MRVTSNMLTRNYRENINRNLSLYNESGRRIMSGRKFTKMSENVSDGTRALNVRTQVYKNEQHQENVKKAYESLSVAESNLMSIEDILNSVHDQTIKALNGTNESASDIYSINFTSLKEQVLEFANRKYNNCYILGGTNNNSVPFEVKNGALCYNGVSVNYINKEEGSFYVSEGYEEYLAGLNYEEGEYLELEDGAKVPYSDSVYMDIGIGLSVKNGIVDPRTAFDMSVSGLDALGYGTSEITYQDVYGIEHTTTAPNNAWELLDQMSKALDERDFDKLGALNEHLRGTIDDLVTEIADIGVRTNYLNNNTGKLEDEAEYMTGIQDDLEYIKDTDDIIDHKMREYTWLLTLQYGGKVLPQSLMDYVQ